MHKRFYLPNRYSRHNSLDSAEFVSLRNPMRKRMVCSESLLAYAF